MRISKKRLASLPTFRLYNGKKDRNGKPQYVRVPYINASIPVDVPLEMKYFTPNGKGLPWACGVSNACLDHRDLFDHPVLYVYTIGTATYILVLTEEGGITPKLFIRYNQNGGKLIDEYDSSDNDTKILEFMIEKRPTLHLLPGTSNAGITRPQQTTGNPEHSEKDKNLKGVARRMARAGITLAEVD